MTETAHTRGLERPLYALAFLLLAFRYFWPGDTVYILDEAFLQMRIDEHFAAGTIPFSNSRGSSIPIPYGPGGQWFYMFLRLFHWHPVFLALAHITLILAGTLVFIRVLRRSFGEEAAAWCALLVASSPLLFFLARHTWDNTLLMPLAAFSLWLLRRLQEGGPELLIHALLGLVIGYGVNTHLMFGAVAVAMACTLLHHGLKQHGFRPTKLALPLITFGLAALLVLLPYLTEAYRIISEERPLENSRVKERWGDGRNLWWLFQRTALYSSLYGANVSFDGVKKEFLEFSGPIFSYFFRVDLFGWFGKLAAWSLAFVMLARMVLGRVEREPVLVFASLSFFFTLLVYQYLNIPTDPHYFNPIWWFVFTGIAWALSRMHGIWRRLFLVTIACTIVVNTAYIGVATAYIRQNRGARNMQTSVVVQEQMRMMRELCRWGRENGRETVKIFKEAFVGEPPFEFLPAHMPECEGVKLSLLPDKAGADFLLHHPRASATSAALETTPALL